MESNNPLLLVVFCIFVAACLGTMVAVVRGRKKFYQTLAVENGMEYLGALPAVVPLSFLSSPGEDHCCSYAIRRTSADSVILLCDHRTSSRGSDFVSWDALCFVQFPQLTAVPDEAVRELRAAIPNLQTTVEANWVCLQWKVAHLSMGGVAFDQVTALLESGRHLARIVTGLSADS